MNMLVQGEVLNTLVKLVPLCSRGWILPIYVWIVKVAHDDASPFLCQWKQLIQPQLLSFIDLQQIKSLKANMFNITDTCAGGCFSEPKHLTVLIVAWQPLSSPWRDDTTLNWHQNSVDGNRCLCLAQWRRLCVVSLLHLKISFVGSGDFKLCSHATHFKRSLWIFTSLSLTPTNCKGNRNWGISAEGGCGGQRWGGGGAYISH